MMREPGMKSGISMLALMAHLLAACGEDNDKTCEPPNILCNGSCVNLDLQNDPNNCGSCGNTCDTANGYACQEGKCTCLQLTECNGRCVDLQVDRENCGGCDWRCCEGASCVEGTCELICPDGQVFCGRGAYEPDCDDICVDLLKNNDNCGSCDYACDVAANQICINGKCKCHATLSECSGRCVDTNTDKVNCGGCGRACCEGDVCLNGECMTVCEPGMTTCCSTQPHCVGHCPGIEPFCSCRPSCVDTRTDAENCGGCNNACAQGQTCEAGQCI